MMTLMMMLVLVVFLVVCLMVFGVDGVCGGAGAIDSGFDDDGAGGYGAECDLQ